MSRKRKLKYRIGKLRFKLQDTWKNFFYNLPEPVIEFFWSFHPRKNRYCEKCKRHAGNSAEELRNHVCPKRA